MLQRTPLISSIPQNKDALELLPEEEVTNPNMYPTQPLSELGEVFVDLGEFTEKYDTIWTEIKSY